MSTDKIKADQNMDADELVYFGEMDDVLSDGTSVDLFEIANLIDAKLDIVDKIINDETWYEGEKRGEPVDDNDSVVYDRVCDIIEKDAFSIVTEAEKKSQSPLSES